MSLGGFCITLRSIIGPYIVFPSKSGGNDCPCSILLSSDNTYELSRCSCGDDTVFEDSLLAFQLKVEESATYNVCFINLTQEMNSTIIHFYELYRICKEDNGRQHLKPYRRYFKSFKLLIGK